MLEERFLRKESAQNPIIFWLWKVNRVLKETIKRLFIYDPQFLDEILSRQLETTKRKLFFNFIKWLIKIVYVRIATDSSDSYN